MRVGKCVPMIALCLLLCSCGGQEEKKADLRAAYQDMTGCEMTAEVSCDQSGLEWSATLRGTYAPGGESTVEVLEPLELAGVRAALREDGWTLEYGEEWEDGPCTRLALEQTGASGGDMVTTVWLRQTDGTPLYGEIAVDGETILQVRFTNFAFCDTITETS